MPVGKSRRQRYSEATRSALLNEATALFYERGFAGTALEDVAAAAEVTRGAVYHHFASKRDLFEAVIGRLEEEGNARVARSTSEAADPWEAAVRGIDAFLEQCSDPVYGRLIWQEGPVALGWARWREVEEESAYGLIEGFVVMLTDAGLLEPGPLELTTKFCFHLLGAAGMALADADEASKEQTKADCRELTLRMVSGLLRRP